MAGSPITPNWPNLEEGSKEEGDHPAHNEHKHDLDPQGHPAGSEDPGIEIEHRHLHEGDCDYVPKLEHV